MHATTDTKKRIIHRLKIARGHLDKVIQMVEVDTYCIDVLHQLYAVEAGIKQTRSLILENHLKTCVADAIAKGKKDEAITEIMEVFDRQGN